VNLIINNRAGGNAPLIADRLHFFPSNKPVASMKAARRLYCKEVEGKRGRGVF
jgi:hypothetical protein